jgi:hypothetical protein
LKILQGNESAVLSVGKPEEGTVNHLAVLHLGEVEVEVDHHPA